VLKCRIVRGIRLASVKNNEGWCTAPSATALDRGGINGESDGGELLQRKRNHKKKEKAGS
jgi:hypothetical protein